MILNKKYRAMKRKNMRLRDQIDRAIAENLTLKIKVCDLQGEIGRLNNRACPTPRDKHCQERIRYFRNYWPGG